MNNPAIYGILTSEETRRIIPPESQLVTDTWLRDTQITVGRDAYYLTGTSRSDGQPPIAATVVSDGLRIWRSEDLVNWTALGLVWRLDDGPAWLRDYHVHGFGGKQTMTPAEFVNARVPDDHTVRRALWAPKIHYSKSRDTYYAVGCLNFNMGVPPERWVPSQFGGTFLLESESGEPTGPWRVATDGPLTHYIDPCLFEDDDGKLYVVWQDGNLAQLNDRLDGLVRVDRPWQKHFSPEPTKEGAVLFKHDGLYHLGFSISAHLRDGQYTYLHSGHGTREVPTSYSFVVASSPHIFGPYGPRYTALMNGGHGCPFADREGNWWACVFIPPGDPADLFVDMATSKRSMGPRLVAMRWVDGQIVPDEARTRAFYARKTMTVS